MGASSSSAALTPFEASTLTSAAWTDDIASSAAAAASRLVFMVASLRRAHRTLVMLDSPHSSPGSSPVTSSAPGELFALDDRLVVVTGASEGIGRAFAECFAAAGAHVVLASTRRDKLDEVRRAIGANAE